ncbi:hypothetical protein [Tahibacter amnicola]|uniref:Anti-sigma factor n=1 Tax=Tahibacter amnicola TaxID=2976241 RepID=A0ABY6BDK9_9GAMM|nr:hypothetical protein [Tahibacter amnicola]UXI67627.1 hypothetical protein N4264_23275 [Tahibacter amnicola]
MSEHEFEWRRRMRDLGGPVQPQRDLWLDIAQRIEASADPAGATTNPAPEPARRRSWIIPLAAAASLMLGVVIGGLWIRQDSGVAPPRVAVHDDNPASALAAADRQLDGLRTQDPRLAGPMAELDSAAAELQQMLAQRPDAVFLVGLLNRTNERRLKLARMGLAST